MLDVINEKFGAKLAALKEAGTYKKLRYLTGPVGNTAHLEQEGDVILLCSNNYINMANRPEIKQAGEQAIQKYGAGAGSVRFICGTFDLHRELEEATARFLNTEAALCYSSCWCANTAVIPTLVGDGDCIISDELNHASIIDGCRAAGKGVTKTVYKHADMASLRQKLEEYRQCPVKLIVTDGVFSMEGDIAPLPGIVALAKEFNAAVMVDDSHATGVIGDTGRGTAEYHHMLGEVDIITGTYGKALSGGGGGFVASSKAVCDMLVQSSRPHLFSNALAPALAAMAKASIEYLEAHPDVVTSLHQKTRYLRDQLLAAGLHPLEGDSAIVPLLIGDTAKAIRMTEAMMRQGLYAIGFGFPVVPEGTARIRIQVSDALTYADLDRAVAVVKDIYDREMA